ncbi:STAS domain-containing protein [Streptomyces sp. NPDC013953]|uniref:STAS domain-containing protein n=1 Tax=Streptomyces sp. NPDC013953 TaxID=3364868 RepID=UPI0036FBEC19
MNTHVQALPDEHDTRIILCSGELDIATTPQLRAVLEQAAADNIRRTVVDLSLVSFADSSLISALVRAHHTQRLVVTVPLTSPLRRIFALTGLEGVLHLTPDLASAVGPEPER